MYQVTVSPQKEDQAGQLKSVEEFNIEPVFIFHFWVKIGNNGTPITLSLKLFGYVMPLLTLVATLSWKSAQFSHSLSQRF